MKPILRTFAPFLLLSAAIAPFASARPRPADPGPGIPREHPKLGAPDAEMRKSMSLVFVHRARVEIGLSDEQVLKLLPLVERVEDSRRESDQRRREMVDQLERLAEDPGAADAEVTTLIRTLDKEEERARADQDRARDEMLALCTPQQKARFVLFAHRFRGMLEGRIREITGGGDRPRPGGMRGRPMGSGPRPGEPPEPPDLP